MVDRLTDEQLDELARMEREATRGPWTYDTCEVLGPYEEGHEDTIVVQVCEDPDDGRFIAAARNALPSLLAEVREWRKRSKNWYDPTQGRSNY